MRRQGAKRRVKRPDLGAALRPPLPTHTFPVEAKAKAVQLLPHGPDVAEEAAQGGGVKVRAKEMKGNKS